MPQLSRSDFVATYGPMADDVSAQTGLDRSVVLGIMATESGWGNHYLGNNVFGITPAGGLAKYPDVPSAGQAFADLINKRYAPQIAASDGTPDGQIKAIALAGYNPRPGAYAAAVSGNASAIRDIAAKQQQQAKPPAGAAAGAVDQAQDSGPAPSADELLQQTKQLHGTTATPGASGAPQAPSADELLQQTRKMVPPPPGAAQPWTAKTGDYPNVDVPGGGELPTPASPSPALNRITGAATSAYTATPPILTPQAQNALDQTVLGRWIYNPALKAVGGALGGVAALGAGGAAAIGEAATGLGAPALGRDINMLAQVAPAALMGAPGGATSPLMSPTTARTVAAGREADLAGPPAARFGTTGGPPVSLNQLTRAVQEADQTNLPPGSIPNAAQRAAGREAQAATAGGSVGAAATPPRLVQITPAEEAMYRTTAEGNKLLENQQPGVRDTNEYLPGVTVNEAEQEQTVNAAREMKSLRIANTEASQDAREAADRNNEIRRQWWNTTRGSDADAFTERAKQQSDIERDEAQVFSPTNVKGDVSMGSAVQQIDNTLSLPKNRENTALQTELGALRNRLVDADGNPRSMEPAQAWGLRQDIDRLTDKRMSADNPNLHYVGKDLSNVADTIDGEIENMAPGYNQMLATYKAHANRLREMGVLKDAELNAGLFRGPSMQMNYGDFQRFMKNVVDARSTPSTDLNPYKSITDDTMQRLWALRDDLRRVAGARELARSPGSDTVPNVIDALKQYAKLGGSAAADMAASHLFGPVAGPLIARGVRAVVTPVAAQRLHQRQVGRMQEMLYPPNPLTPPPP